MATQTRAGLGRAPLLPRPSQQNDGTAGVKGWGPPVSAIGDFLRLTIYISKLVWVLGTY